MKTVKLITPDHPRYNDVIVFANTVYEQKLGSGASYRPTWLCTLFEGDKILGCIGLNSTVSSPLFQNDLRLTAWRKEHSGAVCDQAFFAVDGYPFGVPVLIGTIVAFACTQGIAHIVYAGTQSVCHAIDALGFPTTILGDTDIRVVSESTQQALAVWKQTQNPATGILHTHATLNICHNVIMRHKRRIVLNTQLLGLLEDTVCECV